MKNDVIVIKLCKSLNSSTKNVKDNIRGLGLRKVGSIRTVVDTPCTRGMIKKVIYMLKIIKISRTQI